MIPSQIHDLFLLQLLLLSIYGRMHPAESIEHCSYVYVFVAGCLELNLIRGLTLEKTESPFLNKQPWTAWSPSSRGEALGDSFRPCWHVHWCWFCVGASGFGISQVQHPCNAQLALSPSRWSSLPVPTVFLPSFPQYSLSLGCRSALWVYPPSLGRLQSLVLWILTSCGFLQWFLSAGGEKTFLHW